MEGYLINEEIVEKYVFFIEEMIFCFFFCFMCFMCFFLCILNLKEEVLGDDKNVSNLEIS